jgi:hypothetical protein
MRGKIISMQKIHVIFQGGNFKPLEHVDLPEKAQFSGLDSRAHRNV